MPQGQEFDAWTFLDQNKRLLRMANAAGKEIIHERPED